jgi:hypothetical protein
MFSSADLSLKAGKMRKNLLLTGGFRYDFTESEAASCMHSQIATSWSMKQVTGGIFKISKYFQRKLKLLVFSSTKKQKIVKTISACKGTTKLKVFDNSLQENPLASI